MSDQEDIHKKAQRLLKELESLDVDGKRKAEIRMLMETEVTDDNAEEIALKAIHMITEMFNSRL
jgi:hypothetical protein